MIQLHKKTPKQIVISWGTSYCWFSKQNKKKKNNWAPPVFVKLPHVYVDSKAICALVSAQASKQRQVRLVRPVIHRVTIIIQVIIQTQNKSFQEKHLYKKKKKKVSSPRFKHQNLAHFAGDF